MKIGMDMGNKNLKICGENDIPYEFPVAYEEITEFDYLNEAAGSGVYNVKYNNKFYRVGSKGVTGLPKNKGDIRFRQIANMLKLTGLAIELDKNDMNKGEFKIVTGTPIEDHDAFEADYKNLFISANGDYEQIEVNKKQYEILVEDAYIAKQCSVAKPLIPGVEKGHVLFLDWGGGTLDGAYYIDGTLVNRKTIDYPLNETLERLGYQLKANGIGIDRPNAFNSIFLKEMENVVLEGKYLVTTTIKIADEIMDIKDFANEFLKGDVAKIINDIILQFDFSEDLLKALKAIHFGGGAKLLKQPLSEDKTFGEKVVVEDPEFLNVRAYRAFAKLREW